MSLPSAPALPAPPKTRPPASSSPRARRLPAPSASTTSRLPSSPWSRAVPAALLALVLLLAVLPAGTARAESGRWRWPLPAPHTVLAPFEQPAHRYGAGHRGIDLAVAADGAPVRAVESGTVRFSGQVAGRGVVSVRHADGLISTYEPVLGVLEEGSPVRAGDVLGTLEPQSGASHCAGGTCLHLGARRGERYLDPLPLLGARGPSVLLPWGGGRSGDRTDVPTTAPLRLSVPAGAAGPADAPLSAPVSAPVPVAASSSRTGRARGTRYGVLRPGPR